MISDRTREGQTPRSARLLESALLFTFFAHVAAMATMATLLLPGIPGGSAADVAHRAAYVAQHPWPWRVGWLGWQITAASDLFLAIALLATKWIPKLPAIFAFLLTLAAVIPDQSGQWRWTWIGPSLARGATYSGALATYAAFESRTFALIATWGTLGYLLGAFAWTWCFAAAGVWSRRLTQLSILTWVIIYLTNPAMLDTIPA